jgi:hypothetical protein
VAGVQDPAVVVRQLVILLVVLWTPGPGVDVVALS